MNESEDDFDAGGNRLWRSIEEYPQGLDPQTAEFTEPITIEKLDRRNLLRAMAASFALVGATACDNVQTPLLSYPQDSSGARPGQPMFYATSLDFNGVGLGVLVETENGRPIKIEGNPLHPASLGSTDSFAQAEVLSLYDPDRSRVAIEFGAQRKWPDVERLFTTVAGEFAASGGEGLHILLEPMASPTQERLVRTLQNALPRVRLYRYHPVVDDNARAGALIAFGHPVLSVLNLDRADVILTIGGDLFSETPGHVRYARDYAARRRMPDRPLPRLYAVESRPSLSGYRADRRLVLRPHEIDDFARELLQAIQAPPVGVAAGESVSAAIARELRNADGRALVVPGREQSPAVHAIAHTINVAIGAVGHSLNYIEPLVSVDRGEMLALVDLAEALASDATRALFVLGGNPVYSAPPGLNFDSLIRRIPLSVHLGRERNETAVACRWHIPELHPIESWGDVRAFEGTAGLRQPAIVPAAAGLSVIQALGIIAGEGSDGRALVQTTWRQIWENDFDARWLHSLESGVVHDTRAQPAVVQLQNNAWPMPIRSEAQQLTVLFAPDPSVWDGRFANNAWLQELPKPLSKQVWGNAALLAPATANARGVRSGDVVEIAHGGQRIQVPVWVTPGHAPDTITLPLGYGRTHVGRVGAGVGIDVYPLRTAENPWVVDNVTMRRTGARVELITTQQHHTMAGRDIVRVVADRSAMAEVTEPQPSFYPEWDYPRYAWGMTIDLDLCLGCNACVVACQSENNVPVVGPEEVALGREMHWLRIDRYYAGAPDEPQALFQPVLCMHCEKAPCEIVCPVNATAHDSDGLNQMVYNRCIGTRTCSNNCPYKVRRFNWFDYTKRDHSAPDAVYNPEVTVRERGVMEKCTYCIQRIWSSRIEADIENRRIHDGELMTACQQACPTRALVFGDLNDKKSAVAQLRASPRNYALLGHLNTQPRTTYLARVDASAAGVRERGE